MEQSGVNASREKRGKSERSKNITEIEKIRTKIEKKDLVIISERRVRKLMWIRASNKCSAERRRVRRRSDP